MAVRLPVILAQSSSRSPKQSAAEEGWITHLIFESRLDATLISDLSTVTENSTDQLCLEGIKGDFLLLSWLPSSECMQHLERLLRLPVALIPVTGSFEKYSSVKGDAKPIPSSGFVGIKPKKVYHLQLNERRDFESDKVAVARLLQSLSTPIFQLRGPTSRNAQDSGSNGISSNPIPPVLDAQTHEIPQTSSKTTKSSPINDRLSASDPSIQDLSSVDSLVDELNGLDL